MALADFEGEQGCFVRGFLDLGLGKYFLFVLIGFLADFYDCSTVVICVMRVLTLVRVDPNITYSAAPPLLWSFLEPGVGITVACGPLVGPLLRGGRWIKGNTTKSSQTGGSSSHFERIRDPLHHMQSIHPQNATSSITELGPMGNGAENGGASDSKSISKSVSSSQRSAEYNPMGLKSGFDK